MPAATFQRTQHGACSQDGKTFFTFFPFLIASLHLSATGSEKFFPLGAELNRQLQTHTHTHTRQTQRVWLVITFINYYRRRRHHTPRRPTLFFKFSCVTNFFLAVKKYVEI